MRPVTVGNVLQGTVGRYDAGMTEQKRHQLSLDDARALIAIPERNLTARLIELVAEESVDSRHPALRVRIEVDALVDNFSPEWLEARASELLARASQLREHS